MPGLITHYICGEACLKMLNPDVRQNLEKFRALYNIGTQGPDIFFYYLPGLLKKDLKHVGTKLHKNNVNIFMHNLIMYIFSLKDEKERISSIAYLCGYLTHYVLDYTTHPYIYYKTGFRKKNDIKSVKHTVYHRNFETAIDVLMLKLVSSKVPSDKKLYTLLRTTYKESKTISDAISTSINSTYGLNCTRNNVYNAMKYMSIITRLLQSSTGRKKRFMEFVEDLTIKEHLISSWIHLKEISDGIDYLNLKNESWHMPWDNQKKYNDSFTHLYNKSIGISCELINCVFEALEEKITIKDLLYKIGNNSLSTGIDCDEIVEFKYADVVYEKIK